jgi:hypothetical protein
VAAERGATTVIEQLAYTAIGVGGTLATLHLAAPTATPRGVERRGIALAKRLYRRFIPRSHPQSGVTVTAQEATDG